jgi:hypothetical protein
MLFILSEIINGQELDTRDGFFNLECQFTRHPNNQLRQKSTPRGTNALLIIKKFNMSQKLNWKSTIQRFFYIENDGEIQAK